MSKLLNLVPEEDPSIIAIFETLKKAIEAGEVNELIYIFTTKKDGTYTIEHTNLDSKVRALGLVQMMSHRIAMLDLED